MEFAKDYLAAKAISDGKIIDGYSRIYFKTNEDLVTAYRKIDFLDKDVLSVLASSDHVFTARYHGANSVDAFDKNSLAFYYYYLRVWSIKYMGDIYPDKVLEKDSYWLLKLLSLVRVSSDKEKKAFNFWYGNLKRKMDFSMLFFEDPTEGRTIFKSLQSIGSVALGDVDFYHYDLFKPIESDKSYDVILISNIIEWARNNGVIMTTIRDNLVKLLRDNGVVLCSSLINRSEEDINKERRIFESNFDFQDYGKEVGYTYRKIK